MICCFPDPYPDELLYSVSARFHKLMNYPVPAYTSRELFGYEDAGAVIDLPQHLGHLIRELPPGHLYTVDSLINDHTPLPFYGAFLPKERVNRIKELMEHGTRRGISPRVNIRRLKHFRFCRLCVSDDRKQHGRTYWHRVHQIPGVRVCHIHKIILDESSINIQGRAVRLKFIDAETHINDGPVSPLDLLNRDHKALLQITRDAAWLLEQRNLSCETDILFERCRRLFYEHGFRNYGSKVHISKLNDAFIKYYSPSLLDLLHCSLSPSNWLIKILQTPKLYLQHPLHYLLLIQFLDCSAAKFFQLSKLPKPFGEGPWPCLNAVSDHFKKLTINECKIRFLRGSRWPVGKFCCKCGFEYTRVGPDKSQAARYCYETILACGPAWEGLLKELYERGDLTLEKIAQRLGVTHTRLNSQITRLKKCGFILNPGKESKARVATNTEKKVRIITPETLKRHREVWTQTVKDSPNAGVSAIIKKIPKTHNWLNRHDKEWLVANKPPPFIRQGWKSPIDYKKRDKEAASMIKKIASDIRSMPGCPVWVSREAIYDRIDISIRGLFQKLPLSMKALDEVVETREDYIIRKIKWAAEAYRQEGIRPEYQKLLARARVCRKTAKVPNVKDAINRAIRGITESLNKPK